MSSVRTEHQNDSSPLSGEKMNAALELHGNSSHPVSSFQGTGRSITIGIDARTFYYTDSVARGIGHYSLYHLLHAVRLKPDWQFILYGETGIALASLEGLLALQNVHLKSADEYNPRDVDVMHVCDSMNLLGGFDSPYRIFKAKNTTVTFYDVIPKMLYINSWPESSRQCYLQRLEQLKNSNAVALAISSYTKHDLVTQVAMPAERVEVIMAGLNRSALNTSVSPEKITEVKARLGIDKPFFLHVGALDPHKNFDASLKAFLACSRNSKCQLVVVGLLENYVKAYAEYVQQHRIKNILFTGFLSREDLEVLYSDAVALVFMSLYEGFGFPVLEAMAHGCPVITSNVSSIPEVSGEAALLFAPNDVENVSKAMADLIKNESKRNELRQKGLARAQLFSWDDTARKTIQVWERMLSEPNAYAGDTTPASVPTPQPSATSYASVASETQPQKSEQGVRPSRLQVLYHSAIYDSSGYADEGRNFMLNLDRQGISVAAVEAGRRSDQFKNELDAPTRTMLDSLLHNAPLKGCINMIHFPAYGFQRIEGVAYNIGRTMFETDSLPPEWVAKCNMMDEVWVPSDFNMKTFRDAGVTTRLFKVPSGIDTKAYRTGLEPLQIPNARGMVFLSMFEWSYRKGWDVLLRAWAKAFAQTDNVTLVLRTYPINQIDSKNAKHEIEQRIDKFLQAECGVSRQSVAPIVVLGHQIPDGDLPRLFATASAYVAPSRGEGWGRPQMAAMACGVPVLATRWSANLEFMNDENSFLIDVEELKQVDHRAELEMYRGHRWAEPSVGHLAKLLRYVIDHPDKTSKRCSQARADMERLWDWKSVGAIAGDRLRSIANEIGRSGIPSGMKSTSEARPDSGASRSATVVWEGPLFVNSSLGLVNRELCLQINRAGHTLSVKPFGPASFKPENKSRVAELQKCVDKPVGNPDVHVRHHWPPNLTPPVAGRWVVIQPWEFGSLPKEWVAAFSSQVDEIWAYSHYVKQVYVESGIPANRVHVVPLGIDPEKFHTQVQPFRLKTKKKFRFLFVGGTIYRKGIDLLLEAYTSAFTKSDDVCLVIKDMGGDSFYKGQTFKSTIESVQRKSDAPEIEYIDRILPEGELIGLYTACNVLVHPYRGEGFGLPILEAMACGVPAIVTHGGSCLDFCNDANSYLVKAERKRFAEKKIGDFETVDYPWMYEVEVDDLRRVMQFAFGNPDELKARGDKASAEVRTNWTWEKAFEAVEERIKLLCTKPILRESGASAPDLLTETIVDAGKLLEGKRYAEAVERMAQAEEIAAMQIPAEERSQIAAGMENFKGDCYLKLQEYDNAKASYERALQANPESSEACAGIGEVLFLRGFITQAKTMLEWAVKNDPANRQAQQRLAKANEAIGLAPTHNSLTDAEPSPEDHGLDKLLTTAVEQHAKKHFAVALHTALEIEALLNREGSLETNSSIYSAAVNLQAICHFSMGDLESARVAFERALHIDPASSQACAGLGEVFYLAGLDQQSKTMFEWGVKNGPENASAVAGLKKVNLALGLEESDNTLMTHEATILESSEGE